MMGFRGVWAVFVVAGLVAAVGCESSEGVRGPRQNAAGAGPGGSGAGGGSGKGGSGAGTSGNGRGGRGGSEARGGAGNATTGDGGDDDGAGTGGGGSVQGGSGKGGTTPGSGSGGTGTAGETAGGEAGQAGGGAGAGTSSQGGAGAGGGMPADPCSPNPCRHGARCAITNEVVSCECPDGYKGPRCETGYSTCESGGCDFKQIVAMRGTVCGIHSDDQVECFGNFAGENRSARSLQGAFAYYSGIDPVTGFPWFLQSFNVPLDYFPPGVLSTPAEAAAIGHYHACATQGGTTQCWWMVAPVLRPKTPGILTPPPNSSFVKLAIGGETTCGIRADGTLSCWGDQPMETTPGVIYADVTITSDGMVCPLTSEGMTTCSLCAYPDPEAGPFKSLAVGFSNCVAVRPDGTILQSAWNVSVPEPPDGNFVQVAASEHNACALGTDGTITCWGYDDSGSVLPRHGSFVDAYVGANATCAIRADRTLDCWSRDYYGSSYPPWGAFKKVVVGPTTACALGLDGRVTCFPHTDRHPLPEAMKPPPGTFVDIDAAGDEDGHDRVCAVNGGPTAVCWGIAAPVPDPTPDASLSLEQVSVGSDHVCAIATNHTLRCWGATFPLPPGAYRQVLASTTDSAIMLDGSIVCAGPLQSTPFPRGPFDELCVDQSKNPTYFDFVLRAGAVVTRRDYGSGDRVVPGSYQSLGCGHWKPCLIDATGALGCK